MFVIICPRGGRDFLRPRWGHAAGGGGFLCLQRLFLLVPFRPSTSQRSRFPFFVFDIQFGHQMSVLDTGIPRVEPKSDDTHQSGWLIGVLARRSPEKPLNFVDTPP